MIEPKFQGQNLVLKKFEIYGLFNTFDYKDIKFNTDEGIMIIYGPNGAGKTTILRLIQLFKEGDFFEIANIIFKRFKIYFKTLNNENEIIIEIEKVSTDEIQFNLFSSDKNIPDFILPFGKRFYSKEYPPESELTIKELDLISKEIESLSYTGVIDLDLFELQQQKREELDKLDEQYKMRQDSKDYYSERNLPFFLKDKKNIKEFEETKKYIGILDSIRKNFNCFFISAQRLELGIYKKSDKEKLMKSRRGIKPRSVVQLKSNELISKISENLGEYTKISQAQDKDLVERVINSINSAKQFSRDDIKKELKEIENIQKAFKEAGLDTSEVSKKIDLLSALEISRNWEESKSQILYRILSEVILSDSKKKLKVFEKLYQRIALFQNIINSHLSKNIKFKIDYKKGFVIINTYTNDEIDINLLSSGETHLIVLFYELIFDVEPYSLIMIDEPEISLHIDWQVKFIKNLLMLKNSNIEELKNLKFILATHSPQIVHDRWDLTVELKMEGQ